MPMNPDICFCVRLPHVAISSLAGSPNNIRSVPARHIFKVLQSSLSFLAELDHTGFIALNRYCSDVELHLRPFFF